MSSVFYVVYEIVYFETVVEKKYVIFFSTFLCSAEQDQDIEIIGPITPIEPVAKLELTPPEGEKGSAICVLGSDGPTQRGNRILPNLVQKLPTIHVEHRPPPGRPKMSTDVMSKDGPRSKVG